MNMSLDAVVEAALSRYGFSFDATYRLVNVSENSTYRIDDPQNGQSTALRISRSNYHSEAAIASELDWMDALSKADVVHPPKVIEALDGSRVQIVEIQGAPPRMIVLFEWLSGSPPRFDGSLVPNFRILGSLAARMQAHGLSWKRPMSFERYSCDYDAALGSKAIWGRWQDGLGLAAGERALLMQLDNEIKRRLDEYGREQDRFGLAHNDLRLANLLQDGDELRVIDFDDCGFSWYMYDFATAVSFIEDDPRVPDLMAAWLEGYANHRALSRADLDILPTLVLFRRLLLVGWIGSHHEFAEEARELGAAYTTKTCELAEQYLAGRFLR
jgi:Ser/Thr protein kinase RdoA (MazF antagonist)